MNVLHINTYDRQGGAARAMVRLHEGLRRLGHGSQLLVGFQAGQGPDVAYISGVARPYRRAADRLGDRLAEGLRRHLGVDDWSYRSSWGATHAPTLQRADVVNLHNLHGGYFNFRALPEYARRKPVVWTLHDMWALTGHCAYAYDCDRWQTGCHDCPLLSGAGRALAEPAATPFDRSRQVWLAKRATYQATSLHVVAPSQWLCGLVRQSILGGAATVQCIPYGLDLEVWRPLDRRVARNALDLPADARVIFYSAAGVATPRKGYPLLFEALERLPDRDKTWLMVSGAAVPVRPENSGLPVRVLGELADERLQRLALAAADVFVLPTLADNLPLVLQEALACGTPAVSFDVGGVGELVRHMETGYLARPRDAADLSKGVALLLGDDGLRRRMAARCREIAEAEYSLDLQARRYAGLYAQVLGTRSAAQAGVR